jgi:hypothetical protein
METQEQTLYEVDDYLVLGTHLFYLSSGWVSSKVVQSNVAIGFRQLTLDTCKEIGLFLVKLYLT